MRGVFVRERRPAGTRRFTKTTPRDTRRFKPGWFELVLDLLRSYSARTGSALVPAQHREGNFKLGWMVVYLRGRYRSGQLPPEHVRKLERFPGWSWDPIEDQFRRGLALLERFARREGHTDVPAWHREQGFNLGIWVENLRARRALQAPHKVRALYAVPGWSWRPEATDRRFAEVLAALSAFAKRHGHIRVPGGTRAAGVRLDRWIVLQRQFHHAGSLPRARERALEAVPGWSWRPLEGRFEECMRLLMRFLARHGHCRVPQNRNRPGARLGLWVMQQRQQFRKGRLDSDRVRRLESLPGWVWDARMTSEPRRARSRRSRKGA